MRFRIRQADRLWVWLLVDEAEATVVESARTFPSAAQATAAALAFSHLVARAGKALSTAGPTSGTLL